MRKKELKPNYEIMKSSLVSTIRTTWSDYKKTLFKMYNQMGIDDNGNTFVVGSIDGYIVELKSLSDRLEYLRTELAKLKSEMGEE